MPKEPLFPGVPFLAGMTSSAQSKILVTAYRALGPDATATELRDYIEQLYDFAGIAGVYDFRDGSQRGLSQKDIVIMRWDPAKTNWTAVSRLGGAPLEAVAPR